MKTVSLPTFKIAVIFFASFLLTPPVAARADRIALVMGNDNYESVPVLKKAVNDADAVAAALKDISFDKVIEATNVRRREMYRKLAEFERLLKPGDLAFVYYSGHGVAIQNKNYLLPVDFPTLTDEDGESLIIDESIAVDDILDKLQQVGVGKIFLILDACRDNPLPAKNTKGIVRGEGLAMEPGTAGVFLLYAAGLNQEALDGLSLDDPNPNSVFTRNLVPLLREPGMSQVKLAKKLQKQVAKLALSIGYHQNPAYYDQIPGEVTLKGDELSDAVANVTPAQVDAAATDWKAVENTEDVDLLTAFKKKYASDPLYSAMADKRLAALSAQIPKPATFEAALAAQMPKPANSEAALSAQMPKTANSEEATSGQSAFADWLLVRSSTNASVVKLFLSEYSYDPFYKALAERRLAMLAHDSNAAQDDGDAKLVTAPTVSDNPAASDDQENHQQMLSAKLDASADIDDGSNSSVSDLLSASGGTVPSTEITDCDRLAGAPGDADKVSGIAGVPFGTLDAGAAILACKKDLRRYAGDPRIKFELARALMKGGYFLDAEDALLSSSKSKYQAAISLAIDFLGRSAVSASNYAKVEALYLNAADLGNSTAMYRLAVLYDKGIPSSDDGDYTYPGVDPRPDDAADWLVKALQVGNTEAFKSLSSQTHPQYSSSTLEELQTRLRTMGLYRGPIDGVVGAKTLSAISGTHKG